MKNREMTVNEQCVIEAKVENTKMDMSTLCAIEFYDRPDDEKRLRIRIDHIPRIQNCLFSNIPSYQGISCIIEELLRISMFELCWILRYSRDHWLQNSYISKVIGRVPHLCARVHEIMFESMIPSHQLLGAFQTISAFTYKSISLVDYENTNYGVKFIIWPVCLGPAPGELP